MRLMMTVSSLNVIAAGRSLPSALLESSEILYHLQQYLSIFLDKRAEFSRSLAGLDVLDYHAFNSVRVSSTDRKLRILTSPFHVTERRNLQQIDRVPRSLSKRNEKYCSFQRHSSALLTVDVPRSYWLIVSIMMVRWVFLLPIEK